MWCKVSTLLPHQLAKFDSTHFIIPLFRSKRLHQLFQNPIALKESMQESRFLQLLSYL